MTADFLEITRFSNEGEKLRSIRCLAGRVSVFRSKTEDELQLYRQAIEGTNVKDRFSLVLDGATFNPKEHFFIGFGARDEAPSNKSVAEYLTGWGISPESLEPTLLKMGLGGCAQTNCNSLSPVEWRMIRQIGCLEGHSNREVFFLNDPFLEFSQELREKFAECWTAFTWKHKKVVIVTRLSERPESWLENDFIARIQLERPRQATIGYGGGETTGPSAYELKKLRASFSEQETLTAVGKRSWVNQQLSSPVKAIIGVVCFGLVVGFSVLLTRIFSSKNDFIAVATQSNHSTIANGQQDNGHTTAQAGGATTTNGANSDVHHTQSSTLADRFPDDIQLAWSSALEHPESLLQVGVKRNVSNAGSDEASFSGDKDKFTVLQEFLQN